MESWVIALTGSEAKSYEFIYSRLINNNIKLDKSTIRLFLSKRANLTPEIANTIFDKSISYSKYNYTNILDKNAFFILLRFAAALQNGIDITAIDILGAQNVPPITISPISNQETKAQSLNASRKVMEFTPMQNNQAESSSLKQHSTPIFSDYVTFQEVRPDESKSGGNNIITGGIDQIQEQNSLTKAVGSEEQNNSKSNNFGQEQSGFSTLVLVEDSDSEEEGKRGENSLVTDTSEQLEAQDQQANSKTAGKARGGSIDIIQSDNGQGNSPREPMKKEVEFGIELSHDDFNNHIN